MYYHLRLHLHSWKYYYHSSITLSIYIWINVHLFLCHLPQSGNIPINRFYSVFNALVLSYTFIIVTQFLFQNVNDITDFGLIIINKL